MKVIKFNTLISHEGAVLLATCIMVLSCKLTKKHIRLAAYRFFAYNPVKFQLYAV